MTSMKRVLVSVLLATTLGAGAAPAYAVTDPRPVDPFVPGINEDPDLSAAWQRWQAREIDDYVVSVRLSCFCVRKKAVRTVVRDGRIVKVTRGEHRLRAGKGWSMDGLSIMVREALAASDRVDVDYTPRGVPTWIAIDPSTMIADDESFYSVAVSRL